MTTTLTTSSSTPSSSFRDAYSTDYTSYQTPRRVPPGPSSHPPPPADLPRTAPPRSPPPSIPTYTFQMDVAALNMNTPSPFKKRDLITRTPQAGYHRDWTTSNGISSANPVPMGVVNGEYMYKRPDALTPENSSEEDREEHIEDTPIYLQSERWRNSASQSYHDRYTPEEDYDADSIIGAYNPNQQHNLTPTNIRSSKRYSSISDDVLHSSRFSQTTGTDGDAQTILFHPGSLSRRDITPSKIPIFQASPKPIPMEYIFRSSRLHRSTSANLLETASDDMYPLKRVKSESLLDNFQSSNPITPSSSPTKNKRKYPTLPRPRSRSLGSVKQMTPSSSRTKVTPTQNKRQHETFGEPPWLHHTFSPDPSLPADQQLIPTVAKRIEQERLEREKGLVTVWDREMRPLEGDRRIRESRVRTHKESDEMPTGNLVVEESIKEEEKTWPLGIDVQKTKSVFPSGQAPISPGGPVRVDARTLSTTLGPMHRFDSIQDQRRTKNKDDEVTGKGCCCIVM